MSYQALLALSVYAFVTSISPGPSNFMLLASGANFGFARTLPQLLGITVGFKLLLLGVGFGLGAALVAFPGLHTALKIAGGAYLLYLAWRIGTSRALGKDGAVGRPLTFLQSAAFQWINPKAWVVAVTAMAVYTSPDQPLLSVVADLDRLRAGQSAERVGLGRIRNGAAGVPVRSGAVEMVQHRHGRAACRDAVAAARMTASP